MRIEISPVGDEEVDRIAALARETWQSAYLEIIGQGQIDYMLAQRYGAQRMREELAHPGIAWRKIQMDGELAGFSSCHQDGETLKLDKLYVHPRHQRQGLGGHLIADALAIARARGCRWLILCVNKRNAQAIAAYRKHGFTVRESVRTDIGGGYVMDDHVMEKSVA